MHIYDQDFNRLGWIDNYKQLDWSEDYYSRGEFTMVCVDSPENIRLLQQGYYIRRPDRKTAMIIRYVKYISKDNEIWIRGYTTNDLVNQRAIHKTLSVTNTEQGMYYLVNSCMDNNFRRIPRFITAAATGLTERFDTQFTGVNLLEALEALGAETEVGFYTLFDYRNKQHVFTVYKGIDRTSTQKANRPAVFSTEFQNLPNVTITDDISLYRNVAYVSGGGEGKERTWVTVYDESFTGLDRYELPVDARDLQQTTYEDGQEVHYTEEEYKAILTARGIQKLNDNVHVKTFVAEVVPKGFGVDFYLGDKVSCKSTKYGVRIDTRILSYREVSQNGLDTLSLTMGNPEITDLEVVKSWL